MEEKGTMIQQGACIFCESSDAFTIYEQNSYYNGYCFSCGKYARHNEVADLVGVEKIERLEMVDEQVEKILSFDSRGVRERKIKRQYAEMYGMKVEYDETGQIIAHYYPVTKENEVTGYFKRTLPKTFSAVGDVRKCELQGQHLFSAGGKYENNVSRKFVVVTEGFLDMLAVQQMLNEKKPEYFTAVVSLPNGINAKAFKDNYHFLNSFDRVLICVDQDEVGQKGAKELCKSLPLGKAYVMSFSEKDPCDMLRTGKEDEFYRAFWNAKPYAPAGIVDGSGMWSIVSTPIQNDAIPYPWEGLTKLTHGIRKAEMVTMTGGSGVAKSSFARAIMYHILQNTEDNVGGMFLEESTRRTGLSLMSQSAKKLLHLPDTVYSEEEFKAAFDDTLGTGRVFLYEHFGSTDIDTVIQNITYFVRAADCKYIFLDHISMMVSDGSSGDERKALDEIVTKLRTIVQELDISLFIISHLRRPSGDKGHERGEETSLSQLRGSAGIAQLSDIVIGFERDGQNPDEVLRNTTTVRVLKNRFSGETGVACQVRYNPSTGELMEVIEDDDYVPFPLRNVS